MNTSRIRLEYLHALVLLATLLSFAPSFVSMADDSSPKLSDAQWDALKAEARGRVRHVIYENDGDDCTCYPFAQEPSVEGYLALRTSFLSKYPVDTIFYTPTEAGFGHVSLDIEHADQFMEQPKEFNTEVAIKNIYPYLKSIGTDTLTEQLKYARANGIELFCDIRMNDVHDAADRPGRPHIHFSSYKRSHPEYLFSTWDHPTPYAAWSCLDYDVSQVRAYFLAHVTDIARKYPVDGISFDFNRWPRLFRTVANGGVATDEQRGYITELFRQVRRVTEEAGRVHGRPQLIAIRVPDSIGYCRDIGLDLETLLAEGLVDIVVSAGNFRLNPWTYSKELCDRYGVKMYASIDAAQFIADQSYRLARHVPMAYYARQAAAFRAGIEGCYFFNLFTEGGCRDLMRPSLDSLRLENKRYHLTDRWLAPPDCDLKNAGQYVNMPMLHPFKPIQLTLGCSQTFPLEFGDDIAALKAEGHQVIVRGIIKSNALRDNALKVTSNGMNWHFVAHDDQFLYYDIPDSALMPGLNQLTVEATAAVNAGEMVTILSGKELLRGSVQGSWRRLWDCTRPREAERIVEDAYCFSDFGNGMPNFYYPLAGWDADIVLEFDFMLGDSSDDRCVGVRLANGEHYEALLLGKDSLRLEVAGIEVPFKTTDAFHTYRLRVCSEKLLVEADGVQLLSVPLTAGVVDPRAAYAGSDYADENMHMKGLVLGALSDEGTSISYWKNVRLQMPAQCAALQDIAVEVLISKCVPPPCFTPVIDYNAGNGLPAYPWKSDYAPENLSMTGSNELLRLDNDHSTLRWQSVSLQDRQLLQKLGAKVAFSTRFSMARMPAAPDKEFYTLVLARVDRNGVHQVIVRIARDYIETNFGRTAALFNTAHSHEVIVELDFETSLARLWLDGILLLNGAATSGPARSDGCLMFGDGSGTCGGAVLVENFRIGPVDDAE